MLPWYSLASAQMANNLIKWWRTKFLNGYKQFSVIPSDFGDGRPSDTEELLGHHHVTGSSLDNSCGGVSAVQLPICSTPPLNSCNDHHAAETTPNSPTIHPKTTASPAPSTPPPTQQQPPPTQPSSEEKLLNLEEFSCDVSMEGGIYRDGQERQEFSFTLYDFDGHGKITKDDIAGLVTTIYETLGSSVKVPHYGSKTIKVKLTVSPDQRKRMSATVIDHKSPSPECQPNAKPEDSGVHIKRDLNVTIKDTHRHRRHCRRQQQQRQQQEQQQKQQKVKQHICCNFTSCKETSTTTAAAADLSDCDFSDHCSRITEDEMSEDEGECSEDQILKHPSCEKIKSKRYQKHASPRHHANYSQSTHIPISPVLCTKARRNKKRSSSLQRKELLEIIQANMDKNNHGFQNSRKQCPNHVNIEIDHAPSVERKHRHKYKISREKSTAQLQCLANFVNADNCYLDLATLEGTTHIPIDEPNSLKKLPYCRYDKLLGAVVCMSNKQINSSLLQRSSLSHSPCRNRRHYHSKSHDLAQMRYHLLEPMNFNCHETADNLSPRAAKKPNARLKSYEAEFEQTPAAFKKNVKKFPQVVLGHSSSPHHLKHRNRQEDQARAMAQVVRWLEQEFSTNVNMTGSKQDSAKKKKSNAKSSPLNSSRASPNREANSPSISAVERHEHHHVHEHIHHHYHHYQEAPVVV